MLAIAPVLLSTTVSVCDDSNCLLRFSKEAALLLPIFLFKKKVCSLWHHTAVKHTSYQDVLSGNVISDWLPVRFKHLRMLLSWFCVNVHMISFDQTNWKAYWNYQSREFDCGGCHINCCFSPLRMRFHFPWASLLPRKGALLHVPTCQQTTRSWIGGLGTKVRGILILFKYPLYLFPTGRFSKFCVFRVPMSSAIRGDVSPKKKRKNYRKPKESWGQWNHVLWCLTV